MVSLVIVVYCFFFQAEDGIRDLVRSRGLGDVYKRQGVYELTITDVGQNCISIEIFDLVAPDTMGLTIDPVSYTHLTLPTSDLV